MIKVKALKDAKLAADGRGYIIRNVKVGDEFEVNLDCYNSLKGKYVERVDKAEIDAKAKQLEKDLKAKKETKELKVEKETKDFKAKKKTK